MSCKTVGSRYESWLNAKRVQRVTVIQVHAQGRWFKKDAGLSPRVGGGGKGVERDYAGNGRMVTDIARGCNTTPTRTVQHNVNLRTKQVTW